jgi:glycosyltransferase involved in cell wall biosynthesis
MHELVRPDLSLIVSTIGRPAELRRLCTSLAQQPHSFVELVVVDQGADSAVKAVVDEFAGVIDIVYRTSRRGLSHGRNVGLTVASGRVLAFPDDDCWYPTGALEKVSSFFRDHPYIDILTGSAANDDGKPLGRRAKRSGRLSRTNVWTRGISIAIFLRREVIAQTGGFDEMLGAGSGTPIGSGEETDLLVRALDVGFAGYYDRDLVIHHAVPDLGDISARAYSYGIGMGFVTRRHQLGMRTMLVALVRPLGGCLLALASGRRRVALYYWNSLRGRWRGFQIAPSPPELGPCRQGHGLAIW